MRALKHPQECGGSRPVNGIAGGTRVGSGGCKIGGAMRLFLTKASEKPRPLLTHEGAGWAHTAWSGLSNSPRSPWKQPFCLTTRARRSPLSDGSVVVTVWPAQEFPVPQPPLSTTAHVEPLHSPCQCLISDPPEWNRGDWSYLVPRCMPSIWKCQNMPEYSGTRTCGTFWRMLELEYYETC